MLTHKLILFSAIFVPYIVAMNSVIPPHLLNCYRKNATIILENIGVPYTMEVLIELIRKVELYPGRVTDLRILSTSMLRSLKFDGIQHASNIMETNGIIPVGPTALHFRLYKILLDYLIPGEASQFPIEALTENEMCTLHLMLSSSVQAWERGDEARTCPIIRNLPSSRVLFLEGKQKSTCPIEKGVIKTHWGNLAPGHILTAVAAALHKQDVKLMQLIKEFDEKETEHVANHTKVFTNVYTGDVNNVWAGTVAGDLAEVIIHQAYRTSKWTLGTSGRWNELSYPRTYYLPDSIDFHWEMTLAETLADIDGVIIASQVELWLKQMGRLHFFQILDMYYSRRGITFDNTYRACERKEKILDLLNNIDLVEQITNMAKFLQRAGSNMFYMSDEQIKQLSKSAYAYFKDRLEGLIDLYSACEQKNDDMIPMEILTIIDGSWNRTEGKKLITSLTHTNDISYYGSRMGFINGYNGEWMTNVSHSIHQIFQDLSQTKTNWPTSLLLSRSLQTVVDYLEKKHQKECISSIRSTRPDVILVLSTTSSIGTIDSESSISLIDTIKSINPGISIIYVSSDGTADNFQQLTINKYMNDMVIGSSINVQEIAEKVHEKLKQIPSQILELHCDLNQMDYEDYITPGTKKTYEIPQSFIQTENINVKFKGNDYGDFQICGKDKDDPNEALCKTITGENSEEFVAHQLCSHNRACNVQFQITVLKSLHKCTENDCRYPDQARLSIHTSWTSAATQLRATLLSPILLAVLSICIAFYH